VRLGLARLVCPSGLCDLLVSRLFCFRGSGGEHVHEAAYCVESAWGLRYIEEQQTGGPSTDRVILIFLCKFRLQLYCVISVIKYSSIQSILVFKDLAGGATSVIMFYIL